MNEGTISQMCAMSTQGKKQSLENHIIMSNETKHVIFNEQRCKTKQEDTKIFFVNKQRGIIQE